MKHLHPKITLYVCVYFLTFWLNSFSENYDSVIAVKESPISAHVFFLYISRDMKNSSKLKDLSTSEVYEKKMNIW